MSDHGATAHTPDPAHHADQHDGGPHDEHGHHADAIGPIDWQMWGVGVLGVIVALVVTAGFVVATQFVFLDLAG
jgi:hypothetical protein